MPGPRRQPMAKSVEEVVIVRRVEVLVLLEGPSDEILA